MKHASFLSTYTLWEIEQLILMSQCPLLFTNHHDNLRKMHRAKIRLISCSLNPALVETKEICRVAVKWSTSRVYFTYWMNNECFNNEII